MTEQNASAEDATESTETPSEGDTPGEAVEAAHDGTQSENDDQPSKTGHEAAKYRRQLRDTEAERDDLRSRLANAHVREAERRAEGQLHDTGDLWRYGTDLNSLIDGNGDIDVSKVDEAVHELKRTRPHLSKIGMKHPEPSQGKGGPPSEPVTWQQAAKQARSGRVTPKNG